MERLTFEGNFCDIAQCEGEYRMTSACADGACSQRKVWERLKMYEDTELSPEICAEYKKFKDEVISKGVPFSRIIELMEADKEGRLVVLPCGKGAELTMDGKVFTANHWNITLTTFRDEPANKSGKAVALFSVEEAEAALRKDGAACD